MQKSTIILKRNILKFISLCRRRLRRQHVKACTGHYTCCNQHCQQLFGRAAFAAMIFRDFRNNNVCVACFIPDYFVYFIHIDNLLSVCIRFSHYFRLYETLRLLLNQCFRQSSQQKARRRSLGVVTMTIFPHSRQVNSRCITTEDTFLEYFQYNFSQCCEQNLVRQSLPSVTRTCLPHRRHVNSRITET